MKRRHFLAALVATAGCAAARSDAPLAPAGGAQPGPDRRPPTAVPAGDVQALAEGANAFAFEMYDQLASTKGNFAYSPASISTALAMTFAGAQGETAQQISDVMHFELPPAQLHAAYSAQLAAWNDPARTAYELAVVNRLFGEQTSKFHDAFVQLTGDDYGAPLEPVDFIGAPDQARTRINAWVAEQTHQRIRNLLPPGSIESLTRLVLTNAVYFKGKWKTEFDKKATAPGPFHRAEGGPVSVPMMRLTADFAFARHPEVTVMRMPYTGDELAMDVFVPNERDGIRKLEAALDDKQVDTWLEALHTTEVEVTLPRFKIDPPAPISLSRALTSLGMELPFTPRADFSAMADISPLYIDDVFHKAFVELNEEGTEAAAATAVVMKTESASISEPARLFADRPFVFMIRDLRSGAILFAGRVADPS